MSRLQHSATQWMVEEQYFFFKFFGGVEGVVVFPHNLQNMMRQKIFFLRALNCPCDGIGDRGQDGERGMNTERGCLKRGQRDG